MPAFDYLSKLEFFIEVVDSGSILKASRKLGIAQPHLSRFIKQLEKELDTKLLVRNQKGVVPTIEGRNFYSTSVSIRKISNNFRLTLDKKSQIKGLIRIGTYDSIIRYFFQSFLRYLNNVHPELKISLVTSRSREIYEFVKRGDVLLGLVVEESGFEGIAFNPIYSDRFSCYRSPTREGDAEDCIIYFRHWGQKTKFESSTAIQRFRTILAVENIETVRLLTEQGVGHGILPSRVARQGRLEGSLQESKLKLSRAESDHHRIGLISRGGPKMNHDENLFYAEIHHFLTEWSNG